MQPPKQKRRINNMAEQRPPVNGTDAQTPIYDYNHYNKTGKRIFTDKQGVKHVLDYDAWTFDGEPIRFTWRTEMLYDGATIVVDWVTDGKTKAIGDPDEPLPVGNKITVTVTPKVRSIDNRRLVGDTKFVFYVKDSKFAVTDCEPPNDPNHTIEYPKTQYLFFTTNLSMDKASVIVNDPDDQKRTVTITQNGIMKPAAELVLKWESVGGKADSRLRIAPVNDKWWEYNNKIVVHIMGDPEQTTRKGIKSVEGYTLIADHEWCFWIIGGNMTIIRTDPEDDPTKQKPVDPDKIITIEFSANLDEKTVKQVGNIIVDAEKA
jgi:hypothetical protein